MTAAAESEPRRSRPWLDATLGFVVGALVLGLIAAAVWGGLAAYNLVQERNQETLATSRLCGFGATFTPEAAVDPNHIARRLPGMHVFNHVYKIDLSAKTRASRRQRQTSQLTDQDLVDLNELPRLQELDLEDRPITDAALVHLRGLASLRWLNLRGTRLTPRGVSDLQNALPLCQIHY